MADVQFWTSSDSEGGRSTTAGDWDPEGDTLVLLHPEDATRLGVDNGDTVEVANERGSFTGAITGAGNLTILNTIISGNTAGNEWNPVSCTETAAGGSNRSSSVTSQPSKRKPPVPSA